MSPDVPPDQAFVRAALARPAADAPRLIWADFLDESDRPADRARADLVRTQCALARVPADHPRRDALLAREAALLGEFAADWAAPLAGLVAGYEFRRGLLDSVTVDARAFVRDGAELFRRAPVRRVRLMDAGACADDLARAPHLARVRELDFAGADLGNAGVAAFAASPHLGRLRALELGFTGAGDGGVHALARGSFARLRSLGLGGNQAVTAGGIVGLTAAVWFGRVRSLDVSDNLLDRDAVVRLAGSKLRTLNIAANPLRDAGVVALVRSPLYARLVAASPVLDLRRVQLGAPGAEALAEAAPSAGLESLDLADNPLGDPGVAALAAGHFDRLTRLILARVGLTDRGARRLAVSHVMRGLDVLNVSDNRLSRAGVDALWAQRKDFRTAVVTAGNSAAPDPPAGLTDAVNRVLNRVASGAAGGAAGYTVPLPTGPRGATR